MVRISDNWSRGSDERDKVKFGKNQTAPQLALTLNKILSHIALLLTSYSLSQDTLVQEHHSPTLITLYVKIQFNNKSVIMIYRPDAKLTA